PGSLPHADGTVCSSAGDQLSVRAEPHARHEVLVPGQFSGLRRRVDRPYEDPAVAAARDDLSSVRAEGDGCDVAVMVDPDRILAESVAPEIEPAVAAAGSNSRAVRTDGDLQNAVSGADQGFVTPRSAGSP